MLYEVITQAVHISVLEEAEVKQLLMSHMVFIQFDEEMNSYFFHTVFSSFLKEKFGLLPIEKQQKIYFCGAEISHQAGDRVNTLAFYYRAAAWDKLFALPLTSYDT